MSETPEVPVSNSYAELPTPASPAVKAITIVVIVVPLIGAGAIPFFVWGWGFHWVQLFTG